MNKAEHNFRLLREIEENRRFLLQIYVQNPELLKTADARIKPLLAPLPIEKSAVSTRQRGISLVELIMFIVIVSVALAGIMLVFNVTTKGSADPLVHKQALAAAESLLEEIQLQDFSPASGVTPDCIAAAPGCNSLSVQATAQGDRVSLYHTVTDYNGFNMPSLPGIFSMNNSSSASAVLPSYSAIVAVSGVALGEAPNQIQAGSAVLITVTVTVPQGTQIEISGYRTKY